MSDLLFILSVPGVIFFVLVVIIFCLKCRCQQMQKKLKEVQRRLEMTAHNYDVLVDNLMAPHGGIAGELNTLYRLSSYLNTLPESNEARLAREDVGRINRQLSVIVSRLVRRGNVN